MLHKFLEWYVECRRIDRVTVLGIVRSFLLIYLPVDFNRLVAIASKGFLIN